MPVPAEHRTRRPPGVPGPPTDPETARTDGAAEPEGATRGMLQLRFEREGEVLIVTASGGISLPEVRKAFTQVVQGAVERGLRRALVDPRACTGAFSMADFVALGEHLVAIGIHRLQRIAVLSSHDLELDDDFGETVTRNRGANLRVFDLRDRAMAWLTEA